MKMLHSDSKKVAGPHNRYKRHVETTDKEANASKTIDREVLRKELRLALNSQVCNVHCSRGIRGRRGRPGPRGSPGKHGPLGPQGSQGPKGNQGTQGIQGTPGPKGERGTQGIQGTSGPKGNQGTQGIHGTPGPKGDQGTQGIHGTPGPKGDRGTQGFQGTPGPKGNQGTQGIQGTPGPKGNRGTRGIQGTPGPKGNQGPQGPKGDSWPYTSCSEFKSIFGGSSSGNYVIDPDGKGGVTPFSVYCDMSDKGGAGVTIISHDSESRTHVGPSIPGCHYGGCYSKDVRYTGVSTAQLAALTRISQNCEQFIKFECNNEMEFIEQSFAWWVSRDGTRMNYWGGATGHDKMCACGVTNSCTGGIKCNCDNRGNGWYEDSGLLTDKFALPVTQIRLGDLDASSEEGYHTLGKLKCYGQA
ncbi:uncharacterized protein LOC144634985 isoform X2 [Oculina patagonica]